jgi:patatin-like phospholipase/acyl hydrolase
MEARPLRLLSLGLARLELALKRWLTYWTDGGGVKGLTSLLILEQIFVSLEKEVGHVVHPYQYFDLIGGTSTGG